MRGKKGAWLARGSVLPLPALQVIGLQCNLHSGSNLSPEEACSVVCGLAALDEASWCGRSTGQSFEVEVIGCGGVTVAVAA